MQKPSKKQHYVPQAQLRHFASDAKRRSIFEFSKATDRSYPSSILNAGSENDFNNITIGDAKLNFEDIFQGVDGASAAVIACIVERRSIHWLTSAEVMALADLIAVQLLRTKLARSTTEVVATELRDSLRTIGIDPDQDPTLAVPTDADTKIGTIRAFLDRGSQRQALLRLVPGLSEPSGSARFITSDHPVVMSNPFPYGDQGLTSQGVLVHLPLSPTLMLTMHCPSIRARLDQLKTGGGENGKAAKLIRYRDGLAAGTPSPLTDEEVEGLNRLQITRASKFLYSDRDEFAAARAVLAENPNLRDVRSHVHLGEIGHGPPKRHSMPAGHHLVIHGKFDHCMLAIDALDDAGEGITASTRDVPLLRKVAEDTDLAYVQLYEDGHQRRHMGGVMIELLSDGDPAWFRVVHSNPAVRDFEQRLGR